MFCLLHNIDIERECININEINMETERSQRNNRRFGTLGENRTTAEAYAIHGYLKTYLLLNSLFVHSQFVEVIINTCLKEYVTFQ